MYLSCLLIDVGENPDRPRPGRLWLRNLYRVHQRLCMAFPSASRLSDDPDFIKPYKPEDFAHGQVHVSRGKNTGFLFRIDPESGGRVMILVQSAVKPDWDYAFQNAGYLLAAPPEIKSFEPGFAHGHQLRFRLMANPTRKIDSKSEQYGLRRNGKRVPVSDDVLDYWLARHAERAGFTFDRESIVKQSSYIYMNKTQKEKGRLRSVRFDGILTITDPVCFCDSLAKGIGPGKAFGFGLLSVKPLH